ncbi:PKD domain-containing protein [Stieleria varia]|uniref:PKD domain protein n=1 Tax=Stieleria varia TaxID=2528005 RepID=A0A5C5ZPP4_9BACT|nr:PKD domain-containing protein [Stieleria varia]TWT89482.1 PKD domain protein [Stieleria varia]
MISRVFQPTWILSTSATLWIAVLWCANVHGDCDATQLSAPYTLLVIDKSGSMEMTADELRAEGLAMLPIDEGRKPWEAARVRIDELLNRLSDGRIVRGGLFSSEVQWLDEVSLDSDDGRDRLRGMIDELAPVRGQGSTALFEALNDAVAQARTLSDEDPSRDIAIIVYTDGVDSTQDPTEKSRKRDRVRTEFAKLVDSNPNVWLYYTPIIQGKSDAIETIIDHSHAVGVGFKFPLPLAIEPTGFVLPSAKLNPKATISTTLCGHPGVWQIINDATMKLEFEPDELDGASGPPIQIDVAPVKMREGTIDIPLEVLNAEVLKPDQVYSGKLKITYPTLGDHEIRAPAEFTVRFQAAAPPEIYDIRPVDGSTVPAGQPITFIAQTLQGASIIWDFGDGDSDSNATTQHTYSTEGDRKVTLTVTAPSGRTEKTISLKVIDLAANIQPVNDRLIAGQRHVFRSVTRGPMKRVEWLVDGRPFEPTNPATGELEYAFDRAGEHKLEVLGFAEQMQTPYKSQPLNVTVLPGPSLKSDTDPVYVGQQVKLTVDSPPGWKSISWDFDDGTTVSDGGAEQTHTFKIRKTHRVRAVIEWTDGPPQTVELDAAIKSRALVAGIDLGGDAKRFYSGDTLPLNEKSTGDIWKRSWSVRRPGAETFEPLVEGATSLPLDSEGEYEIRSDIESYPDEAGATQTASTSVKILVLPKPNRAILWSIGGLLAALVTGAYWVLVHGNKAMFWHLRYRLGGDFDADNPGSLTKVKWNPFRKQSAIELKRMVPDGFWRSAEGKNEKLFLSYKRAAGEVQSRMQYTRETQQGRKEASVRLKQSEVREDKFLLIEPKCNDEASKVYLRVIKRHGIWWLGIVLFLAILGLSLWLFVLTYQWVYSL